MHYLARIDSGDEYDLLRADRQIDGWRYVYLRSVEKSRRRLIRQAHPFDVTLFVVEADKRRRYVARIVAAECLHESHAVAARAALAHDRFAPDSPPSSGAGPENQDAVPAPGFNIRFRVDDLRPFAPHTYAPGDDPAMLLHRYQLHGVVDPALPPSPRPPEYAAMRGRLLVQLHAAHPQARVAFDTDGADVLLDEADATYVFAIRTELSPRAALRRALDGLVERYLDSIDDTQALRLVVVVRREPGSADLRYLSLLRGLLGLPIACRVVSADDDE